MIKTPATSLLRATSRCLVRARGASLWTSRFHTYRQLRQNSSESNPAEVAPTIPDSRFELFREAFSFPTATDPASYGDGKEVNIHGFLGKRRDKGQKLSFYDIRVNSPKRYSIQIVSSWESEETQEFGLHQTLRSVPQYSPVCICGVLKVKRPEDPEATTPETAKKPSQVQWELKPLSVKCLNTFPTDIIVSKDAVWPPKYRHLQMRFDNLLYERLRFRNAVVGRMSTYLRTKKFIEVETPVLFKSTPEGAREFLVPTRRKGFAYALPQSPQQYKQILMSGGISNYFQFAKCFRDEDHRADRQPEFTQLDLEMSFATGKDVMKVVNSLIKASLERISQIGRPTWLSNPDSINYTIPPHQIRRMPYQSAMSQFGIDKPDLRITTDIASYITNVGEGVTSDFKSMITSLDDPVVEACKFRFTGSREDTAKLIREFFYALPNTTNKLRGDSTPAVFIFDSSQPLQGLSALGHEAAQKLVEYEGRGWKQCEDGDVIIMHARENQPFQGGSTELGRLRKLIYDAAVERGLMPKDPSLKFVWITDFPLFSPNGDDPGQGGSAGFCSTHHPFTAPLMPEDVSLLQTNPLKATADHYDLVLNGVEIGGGSRRIHVAEVQEYVMREVLKMTDQGIAQFSHLLEALRAGCPPHAGFALGFDRYISILCDTPSVKDIIAFPKDNKGEDKLVGSPSMTTLAQQRTYHLFTEPPRESTPL